MKWSEPKVQIKIENLLEVSEIFSKNHNWKISLSWHHLKGFKVEVYKWNDKKNEWNFVDMEMQKVPSYVSHEFYCKQREIEVVLHG